MVRKITELRLAKRSIAPGPVLSDWLKRIGVTQDELAKAMRVSRLTVNQIINERRIITVETAMRLAAATGTTAEFWLNVQRAVELFDAREKFGAELAKIRVMEKSKAKFAA